MEFLNIRSINARNKQQLMQAFEQVLDSGWFILGNAVKNFEQEFATFCGTKHCIAVANGLDALILIFEGYKKMGIMKQGDEVLVPANTYIASILAISKAGLQPVLIEPDINTYLIDPSMMEEKITPKTKAILPVHLYGQLCNMKEISTIAKKYSLKVIEDSAQSHGAIINNKRSGAFGDASGFSFYPGKNLGTFGEGGGVITNSDAYYKKMCSLRNHGSTVRYYHDEIGYNWRMGGIEGAVLEVKLKYIDQWNARRKEIAARYKSEIKNDKITFQAMPEWGDSAYHLFVVTVPDREDFMQYMNKHEIFPGLHYPVPCHLQKAYEHLGYKKGDFPHSEYLAEHCVSLPIYAELKEEDVTRVIETINAY